MELAYITARAVDDESWSGGLLVTDLRGLPLDFRYVEPIKPSKIQKLVYGGALRRYLLLDAIASTLLKAAKPTASWFFTGDELLRELEPDLSGKLVVIEPSDISPLSETGEWKQEEVGMIIMQVSPTGNPVKLTYKSSDESDTETIAGELVDLASELDFTEPLLRVGEALKEICNNGVV